MENKEKLLKIIKEASEIKKVIEDYKTKININSDCMLLNNAGRFIIATQILPFLEIKDIINFRSTCKDVNSTVNSNIFFVSYYKAINKKRVKEENQDNTPTLKPLYDVVDMDDIQAQLESVKAIKEFLTQKLFQSESIIKLYKNDVDYLKSELKTQNEMTEKLNEALSQTRNELEETKRLSNTYRRDAENINRKYDMDVILC